MTPLPNPLITTMSLPVRLRSRTVSAQPAQLSEARPSVDRGCRQQV